MIQVKVYKEEEEVSESENEQEVKTTRTKVDKENMSDEDEDEEWLDSCWTFFHRCQAQWPLPFGWDLALLALDFKPLGFFWT